MTSAPLSSSPSQTSSDLPSVFDFDTKIIPYQQKILTDIYKHDYANKGLLEIICSGSVGSAKSAIAAYIGVRHVLEFPGATLLIARKALPDIKDTIYRDIIEMLHCEELEEGKDYKPVDTRAHIKFRNGSQIIARSWADRKYKKLGSLKVSAAIIEELAENDEDDQAAYDFITMRTGRLPNIPHKWIISLTNPDEPDHWVYKRLVSKPDDTRKVYYSTLKDNPFLDEHYERRIRETLDPMMARRMIGGEWISVRGKTIYRQYDKNIHYTDKPYEITPKAPIHLNFDFNVAENKPMSACASQYYYDHFHYFKEWIVEGIDTKLIMEEIGGSDILENRNKFIVHGDATGKHKSSKSLASDYDQIREYLTKFEREDGSSIEFDIDVPLSNPPVKTRHKNVNAYLRNANDKVRLTVYNCTVIDEGLRLTKLKKGADYIEDDSKPFQHVTTAIGYDICTTINAQGEAFEELSRWGDDFLS